MDLSIQNKFLSCEDLAHNVAYEVCSLPSNKPYIHVWDNDGVRREYKVSPISSDVPGLVVHALIPVEQQNPNLHLVFRGTKCMDSVGRDLSPYAPGHETYEQAADKITAEIQRVIAKRQKTVSGIRLSVSGHSLGGSDAQRCAADIIEEIAINPESPLAKIESLTINHANSGGVAMDTAEKAYSHIPELADKGIIVERNAIFVVEDHVQRSGETMILKDADPRIVTNNVLVVPEVDKFDVKQAVVTTRNVTSRFVNGDGTSQPGPMSWMFEAALTAANELYKLSKNHGYMAFDNTSGKLLAKNSWFFSNSHPGESDLIADILDDKHILEQDSFFQQLKSMVYSGFARAMEYAKYLQSWVQGSRMSVPRFR